MNGFVMTIAILGMEVEHEGGKDLIRRFGKFYNSGHYLFLGFQGSIQLPFVHLIPFRF